MKKVKAIHFVGIKGVGMTPLAIIAKQAGIKVTGSDVDTVFITDSVLAKHEITVFSGFSSVPKRRNTRGTDNITGIFARGS